ncbi:OmpH family outer membrane protein [Solitalea lacus]|uniref:OmpH family outer membrane protein n=1 Tax=Solitalea lacus TaxID=2911172 RepID=UPI001EDBAEF9|nr:OmpH family outer membrane protein [Solitalea lacus]UKJ08867.1 OmpH family outer membrane protein [Solitalea lacus]
MKRILLTLMLITSFGTLALKAQKIGYVDTEYVLKHMPEYTSAQKQINALSEQWQKEVDQKFNEVDALYKAYQSEQMLLTDAMRKKREEEIVKKEKEAKDFQKQKFGPEGELFAKQKSLVKPIQDKVYKVIEQIAEDGMYAIIFDKSNGMLYSSPRYDKSNDVLAKLGLKPGEFAK